MVERGVRKVFAATPVAAKAGDKLKKARALGVRVVEEPKSPACWPDNQTLPWINASPDAMFSVLAGASTATNRMEIQ